MFFWSAFPFVRIIIAFGLGIIGDVFLPELLFPISIVGAASFLFLVGSTFIKPAVFIKQNWAFGLLLICLSFSLGYLRLYYEAQAKTSVPTTVITAYKGLVVSQPLSKGNFYKSVIKISNVKDSVWHSVAYKINLYVRTDSIPFEYGDYILVKGSPTEMPPPQNPDEFNYKRYLSFLTIYQQHFSKPAFVKVISSGNGNWFIATSLKLRTHYSALLESYIKSPKEAAIAKALLLGNKNELDDDIKNTYAASGAMHVLAVSGLHVGIIYGIIVFLFALLPKQYQKKWLIATLSIPLLWGYAFITGLSPSVLRAVTLFSIIAIGNSFNRRANMVNLLAVSAFILLLFKPYLLMQVGFQLSYVAVLGIIFIYPQIRKLWLPHDRVRIFFWDIISISIAAQIATFPLSILYFHRFPPYFLISNLLVIPAATLIVGVGIAFFTFSYFSLITQWLGWLLTAIIRGVNAVLEFIYQLPGSDLNNIYLDVPQTWVLYFIICFLFLFVVHKNLYWARWASFSILIFTVLIGHRRVNNNRLKQMISYKVSNHYAVDFIQSGEVYSVMDPGLMSKPDKIHFHINPNRMRTGASQPLAIMANKAIPLGIALVWNNKSILILDKPTNEIVPFDVVIAKGGNLYVEEF